MSVTEALLARIVDYAGLFPPAALDMTAAVQSYERFIIGDEAWMLGSFVVPAGRLEEFKSVFDLVCCTEQEAPWTLSVVCAGEQDRTAVEEFQEGAVFLRSVENKASDAREMEAAVQGWPEERTCYVEIPADRAGELVPLIAAHGARAKLRTGGLRPEAIPSVESIVDFLIACARDRVPWKATAGLHHALRGRHPLTEEAVREDATMHGFLNLFLAGALAWFGAEKAALVRTLEEQDPDAFQVEEDVIRWHGHALITDQIEQVRSDFAVSFGSCSFAEPVAEIRNLGWL